MVGCLKSDSFATGQTVAVPSVHERRGTHSQKQNKTANAMRKSGMRKFYTFKKGKNTTLVDFTFFLTIQNLSSYGLALLVFVCLFFH